jgi:hypothetical protein
LVHAGAVGYLAGGVLLAGKGGSGKSNTALSCLNSSLSYLSDDYCILSLAPTPTLHSLYSTGKIHPADLQRLPFLATRMVNRERLDVEKALFFLYSEFSDKIATQLPLRAILIPQINGSGKTTIERTTSVAGLLAMAPSTMAQLPYAGSEVMEMLGELVRQVPCYYLNLSTDTQQTVHAIEKHLTQLIDESRE